MATSNVDDSQILAVSCASASFCSALEPADALTFTNGTWSAPDDIDNGGRNSLGVSCPRRTSASRWTMEVTRSPSTEVRGRVLLRTSTTTGSVRAVSCATTTFCVAVDAEQRSHRRECSWSTPLNVEPRRRRTHVSLGVTNDLLRRSRFVRLRTHFHGVTWSSPEGDSHADAGGLTWSRADGDLLRGRVHGRHSVIFASAVWSVPLNVDQSGLPLSAVSAR